MKFANAVKYEFDIATCAARREAQVAQNCSAIFTILRVRRIEVNEVLLRKV